VENADPPGHPLLVVGGAYTAFWLVAAGSIKEGVAAWAESARAQQLDVAWQAIGVSGYPFAFRIELSAAGLRNNSTNPAIELRAPIITATTRPWAYRVWRITAAQGLDATAGNASVPIARIRAEAGDASVSVPAEGGVEIWLGLRRATAEPGAKPENRVAAERVEAWLNLPAQPPREHDDRNIAVA
jgi:hypothetical protein